MSATDLAQAVCEPCQGIGGTLPADEARALLTGLHPDWTMDDEARAIQRAFKVKGFAKAVYLANLAAYNADRDGHHPDVAFGWGYCRITFTSHELGGLTKNDFICAAKLDKLVA
ncbi:4a-hydroxytetrahydrobiopterin dehydratase [Peteryoungia desertarenae]|uniref:4a-hydroxytetrahydrobiopterin dehydratase n=1 Tax=Peteryoungia desertarenae TaxID=1813451 RepID=A0ABX6QJ00_9HYPH|nr:4a-hydroxytetrahydrobiopterin dehydratase [Peteryoungia desertarenae]QLF68513.1 4a-hydroxytetrahydrobiopterin dehydratase [Peteryoungia desertarenae]